MNATFCEISFSAGKRRETGLRQKFCNLADSTEGEQQQHWRMHVLRTHELTTTCLTIAPQENTTYTVNCCIVGFESVQVILVSATFSWHLQTSAINSSILTFSVVSDHQQRKVPQLSFCTLRSSLCCELQNFLAKSFLQRGLENSQKVAQSPQEFFAEFCSCEGWKTESARYKTRYKVSTSSPTKSKQQSQTHADLCQDLDRKDNHA